MKVIIIEITQVAFSGFGRAWNICACTLLHLSWLSVRIRSYPHWHRPDLISIQLETKPDLVHVGGVCRSCKESSIPQHNSNLPTAKISNLGTIYFH